MSDAIKKQDLLLITLLGVAHGLSHFFHLVLPPLFPWIMPDLGLSFAQMGAVMTLFFIVSSVGQAASGFVVDRMGPKVCLLGGVTLLMLAGFLFATATNYWMLFPASAVAGLGNCVFHPADYAIINRSVSPERLPFAFSIHSVVANVGWALAPLTMMAVVTLTGQWRLAAVASGVIALLVLLVLIINRHLFDAKDDVTAEEADVEKKTQGAGSFAFLKILAVWLCFFFFFTSSFAFGILQNFAPSIFNATYDLGLELATTSLTSYIVGSITGILSGAWVAKRFQRNDRVVAASMALSACCAILLASQILGGWAVLPLMCLMGFGVGVAMPSRDLLIRGTCMKFLGTSSFGRVFGFTYCGMDVGQTLSPLIAGPLLDAGFFSFALVLVGTFQTLALLTALGVGQQRFDR